MKIEPKYIIIGTVIGTGIILYDLHQKKKKKEQKKAKHIFNEVDKVLFPNTKGVDALLGLDTTYLDSTKQKVEGVVMLHPNTADRYAKQLYNAFNPWYGIGNDEQVIYQVLGNLKDHVELSQVAKRYLYYDPMTLKQRIQSDLDTQEIEKVIRILSKLKPYHTREGRTLTPDWNRPFDMNYTNDVLEWVGKPIQRMPLSMLKKLAFTIKNARGDFWDNEKKIRDVFKKTLKDKTQVSDLSKVFHGLYKKDMWLYIRSFLNDWQMENYVSRPVSKLDNYKL